MCCLESCCTRGHDMVERTWSVEYVDRSYAGVMRYGVRLVITGRRLRDLSDTHVHELTGRSAGGGGWCLQNSWLG